MLSSQTQSPTILPAAVLAPQPALKDPTREAAAVWTPLIHARRDGEGDARDECRAEE
jgi:hypothetical protein